MRSPMTDAPDTGLFEAATDQSDLAWLASGSDEALGRIIRRWNGRLQGFAERYLEINGLWEDHVRYAITSEEWWDKRDGYTREWLTPLG